MRRFMLLSTHKESEVRMLPINDYFKQLKKRSIIFDKFSLNKENLKEQISNITSTDKNYILITSKYDDYIFWGIKEIDK